MSVYGSPEGVVDCNGAAVSEGGTFISLARSLGNNSSAYNKLNGFCLYENSNSNFDEVIRITCSDGVEIISFVPKTSCSMILITSELFESGKEYKIEFGSDVYEYNCTDGIVNIR